MKKLLIKTSCLLLILGLNWTGLFAIGETFAHFNDAELSSNNSFETGVLDFSLTTSNDFSQGLEPCQSSIQNISVLNNGTLGFKYKISTDNFSGGLCDSLILDASLDGVSKYNALLTGFVDYNVGEFANPEDWVFTINLNSSDPGLQGEICNFKFIFNGWQTNLSDNSQGFTDTEEVQNTVYANYWNPFVLLNEFLPNANLYPEFIEIYNKTGSSIDLNGFYIMANTNRIDINSANTSTYSGGLTTIGPNGWLVITAGGDLLGDSSGTLTLYNPNDVKIDSYAYSGGEYNVNNSPGWTNNLAAYLPFDGDLIDQSGNSNNGTNYGTVFDSGKINQGLSFDGTNRYVEIPDSSSLDIIDEITLEAWVYPKSWDDDAWPVPDKSTENSILTKAGDSDYGAWNLHYKTISKGFRFELNNGSTQVLFESSPSMGLNTWYHVVGTYNGSEMKLYINGSLSNSLSISGQIATNDMPLRIGKQFWYDDIYSYWDGLIDEVKIYNRALNADEVLEHYNAANLSGSVPVDKSYARIPDGSANWVDPIPTPGGPNILEPLQNQGIEQTENDYIEDVAEVISKSDSFEDIIELEEDVIEEEIIEELINEPAEELLEESVEEPIIDEELIEKPIEEEVLTEELLIDEELIEQEVTTEENIIEENIFKDIIDVIEETVEEITGSDQEDSDEVVEVEEEIVEEETVEEIVVIDEIDLIEVEEEPVEEEIPEEIIEEQQPVIEPEEIIIEEENNE